MANMQNENYESQYDASNYASHYTIKNHQHHGYQTQNYEYEISNIFPSRPSVQYQKLFDFRIQLLLLHDTTINSGETQSIPTTCTILPNNGWFLTVVSNPALSLILHERYISSFQNSFRLHVSVTNTSNESQHLPATLCVGYLLLKCG